MLDSSRKLSVAVSEMPRHGTSSSVLMGSNYSCSPSSSTCHCASSHAQLPHSELSQKQSALRLPRRLPIPPIYASPSPTSSTFSSSTHSSSPSIVSLAAPYPSPHRSYSLRPLPKMPELPPGLLEAPNKHDAQTAERSPPSLNTADSMVSFVLPQCPSNVEEIRRGNLSKLRRHLGRSVPPDLIPPKLELDLDEASSSSSDEEQDAGPASAPIRPACLSTVTPIDEKPIKRWEKKGRRWVAEDYNHVLQCLRELR